MGVRNQGFAKETERLGSWESAQSALNPYADDSPFAPTVMQTEMTPRQKSNSISKSDVSSCSDPLSPYVLVPGKEGPHYEDLAAMTAKLGHQPNTVNSGSRRKHNMLYETSYLPQHGHNKTQARDSEFEGKERKHDHTHGSNCCLLIFAFLAAILAIVALAMVFLLVFGVISAKKCEECAHVEKENPSAGKQVVPDQELALLTANLTKRIADSHNLMTNLNYTFRDYFQQIISLGDQLAQQKTLTHSLNKTVEFLMQDNIKRQQEIDRLEMLLQGTALELDNLDKLVFATSLHAAGNLSQLNSSLSRAIDEVYDDASDKINATIDILVAKLNEVHVDQGTQVEHLTALVNSTEKRLLLKVAAVQQRSSDLYSTLESLNNSFSSQIQKIQLTPGPVGPPGLNGSEGPPGRSGNLSACEYVVKNGAVSVRRGQEKNERTFAPVGYNIPTGKVVVGAHCSSENAHINSLAVNTLTGLRYLCQCMYRGDITQFEVDKNGNKVPPIDGEPAGMLYCDLHLWLCPA